MLDGRRSSAGEVCSFIVVHDLAPMREEEVGGYIEWVAKVRREAGQPDDDSFDPLFGMTLDIDGSSEGTSMRSPEEFHLPSGRCHFDNRCRSVI